MEQAVITGLSEHRLLCFMLEVREAAAGERGRHREDPEEGGFYIPAELMERETIPEEEERGLFTVLEGREEF